MTLLTPHILLDGLSDIFSKTELFKEKDVDLFLIANEKAGGFTQTKESEKNHAVLEKHLAGIKENQVTVHSINKKLLITERKNHGEELVREIAAGVNGAENSLTLVVSAGGDGTSLEVQTGLIKWALQSEENASVVRNKIVVFRLPLGTGNDGTDGHVFEESLNRLYKPLHFANSRAVKFSVNREVTEEGIREAGKNPCDYGDVNDKAPWYAFNIAGVGLDAFVCWKTNEEKTKHPGNHYQLMVDFATLHYNKQFPPKPAEISLYEGETLVEKINTAFEMVAFGASGHRTFGSGKKIFPDSENISIVRKLDVFTMVSRNYQLSDGTYVQTKLGKTYKGTKMVIEYDSPIICELDGETHLLLKENFPVTMELTEPYIQILECDDLAYDHGTVRK